MPRNVFRSSVAETDLAEIAQYLAERSLDSAIHFLDAAESTFEQLADSPELGVVGEYHSKRLAGVRRWRVNGFKKYLVFYREIAGGIHVLRVLHGARDIEAIFGE